LGTYFNNGTGNSFFFFNNVYFWRYVRLHKNITQNLHLSIPQMQSSQQGIFQTTNKNKMCENVSTNKAFFVQHQSGWVLGLGKGCSERKVKNQQLHISPHSLK
jgi:hypothetical protein